MNLKERRWKLYLCAAAGAIVRLCANEMSAQTPPCHIRTFAGVPSSFVGQNVPAREARLFLPSAEALDAAGNLYVTDGGNHLIRRISPLGIVSTFAGNGRRGFSGDGGTAVEASLNLPTGLAFDARGNAYFADTGNRRVRRISPDGIITTIAGSGASGDGGDGGPAVAADFYRPTAVAVDRDGNVYVADYWNDRIRRISPDGMISGVAGRGQFEGFQNAFSGDGGPAIAAQLFRPYGIAVDADGNVYIADTGHGRIRKVDRRGLITTFAGNGESPSLSAPVPQDVPATSVPISAAVLVFDAEGSLHFVDGATIRRITRDGLIRTVATINAIAVSLVLHPDGSAYVTSLNDELLRITPGGGATVAAGIGRSGFAGDGGAATAAKLFAPGGVAVDGAGNVLIADTLNNRIRRISPQGVITTFAGTGEVGFSGDGGTATAARLSRPASVAVDQSGNVFIADTFANRIRKVTPDGLISTVAGNGQTGMPFDGPATATSVYRPRGVAVDNEGNIYISDGRAATIRRLGSDGMLRRFASVAGASLNDENLRSMTFDRQGNLYVIDRSTSRVWQISPTGAARVAPGTSGFVWQPNGIAVDDAGNLYLADGRFRIIKITADGLHATIAGSAAYGFEGEGAPAAAAAFLALTGLALDRAGNLYISDSGNSRIRALSAATACSVAARPTIGVGAIVNGASFQGGLLAPGEIVSIFGVRVGPPVGTAAVLNEQGRLPTSLGGTRVLFDGVPAPLLYASETQINAIVPYATALRSSTRVEVEFNGVASESDEWWTSRSAPGVFALVNQDSTRNSAANPAAPGSVVIFYATGEGLTVPPRVDGELAQPPLPTPQLPVRILADPLIGDSRRPLEILFAGAAPGFAGLLQINVRVPADAAVPAMDLRLVIGGWESSQSVRLHLRP